MNTFLPTHINASQILARIGLISDTHMPERCRDFPPALFEVFAGVDFILHAGDVGELWVLDKLSQIAPIIAVHGNDEAADAQRELPYQQVTTIAGQRILLWHSHYPDHVDEMDSRKHNQLNMARHVQRGKRAGASIVVFGHWHIPLVYEDDGVTVINPGALASGNSYLRGLHQTVALLFLCRNEAPIITHVDLAQPDRPFVQPIDFDASFMDAAVHFQTSILTPELDAALPQLRTAVLDDLPHAIHKAFYAAINRAGHRCWSGGQEFVSSDDWLAEVVAALDIPEAVKTRVAAVLKSRSFK